MTTHTPTTDRPRPRDWAIALAALTVLNVGIPLLAELATGGLS